MTNNKVFYDTCSLLIKGDSLFNSTEDIYISSITLEELENIKTSANKDADVKFAARKMARLLDDHFGEYTVIIYSENMIIPNALMNPDMKIIACAKSLNDPDIIFVTNDICCKHLARQFFTNVISINEDKDDYTGYKEIYLNDEDMATFYENQDQNLYDLHINEYILIYSLATSELVDTLCWTGSTYRHITYNTFSSQFFGDIKPMKGDIYQSLAADSLNTNQITMINGPAGSGKTFLSLGFLLHKLERNQIDKIIVFCNTVATKNSAKLGYYPGTRDEKLLDSQIGNLLTSKLGGRIAVERMIENEQLVLLPLSDIRGYDTTGMKAGIYISEAQNMDIGLMKLVLQRIGEDSICIIDGDEKTQVDDISFAGANNGMRRASKVFRGAEMYGEVQLKVIHRSRIAEIAEAM